MSMLNRPASGTDTGEIVASTRDYENAQKTVSKLIAGEVPARDIAIVGQSVRTVERVTGRLGYAAAARSGAINGVLIGLFLSAILVLGNPEVPIQLFVGFVLIGVAVGMLLSLITYAIVRRRRDFASVTQFAADHYEVTVQPGSLAKARQVLGSTRVAPVRPPVNLDEPPRYGERITPGGTPPVAPAPAPGADPAPGPDASPAPTPAGTPAPGTDPAPGPEAIPAPGPDTSPAPAPGPGTNPAPTPAPEPGAAPAPEPGAAPAPAPAPEPGAAPAPEPGAAPAPAPEPGIPPRPADPGIDGVSGPAR